MRSLITAIGLAIAGMTSLSTYAQNTITFDDQSYTDGQNVGNPYYIVNNTETFVFQLLDASENLMGNDQFYRTTNTWGCSGSGTHSYIDAGQSQTQVRFWSMHSLSGSEFDLGSIDFNNIFHCYTFCYSLTMEGFKDGASVGTQTFSACTLSSTYTANSTFDDIDSLVISEPTDMSNMGIDNIVWTANGAACNQPGITSFSAADATICTGQSATLTVAGSLNAATAWHLYSGSCGGTPVSSNTTGVFSVSPSSTTTYYVRGEDGGGCVPEYSGSCRSVTIYLPDVATPATLNFQDQYYFNGQDLPNPYSITAANGGSLRMRSFGASNNPLSVPFDYIDHNGACAAANSIHMFSTGHATAGQIRKVSIASTRGEEFQLTSMNLVNTFAPACYSFQYNITVEGFKDGNSTGTQAITVVNLNNTFAASAAFNDVDSVVLSEPADMSNMGIDDIVFQLNNTACPAVCNLAAGVSSTQAVSCNGGSNGTLTATPSNGTSPYTYLWSNATAVAAATGLSAGTYTVTITDASGCTATASQQLSDPVALVSSTTVNSAVSCNGGSDGAATASATGGTTPYTYLWSNASTSAAITGLIASTYTVTTTDANGCTSTASSSISAPSAITATITINSTVSCNGGSDGAATASATGGTTPYTYLWSNASTSAGITGLAATTYTVTITDANGCTATNSNSISEPAAVAASITVNSTVSCYGGSDGGATASASGGTTPYTYLWSNAATSAAITGLAATTYTVTITDANGCTATNSNSIAEPTALVATATTNNSVSCNGAGDGAATVSATGGTTAYTYAWSTAATTAAITSLAGGTYTATVTDANGCTSTASTTINDPAVLAATITPTHINCSNVAGGGTLTAAPTGGTAAFTYLWSNAATTAAAAGLASGDYTVTITDASGCTATATETMWFGCDQVVDLRPMNKQDVSVYLTWDTVCGASKYKVVWKELGATAWQVDYKHTQNGSYHLTGLNPSTTYRWAIKADCGVSGWGLTAVQQGFTTLANPCNQPTGMNAAPVGLDKAKLIWTQQPTVHKYRIRWRQAGTTTWTVVTKDAIWAHHWLTGLANSTTYEWQMRSVCEAGAVSGTFWTASAMFTTATPKHLPELTEIPVAETVDLHVFPNPARGMVRLALDAPDKSATALLYDVSGRLMLQQRVVPHADNTIQLDLPAGVYLLKVEGKGWMKHQQLVVY